MKENKVKRTLAAGGISVGTMVFEFKTSGIARIAAEAGADFAVFDMEHTGWNEETIGMLVATGRAAEIVPIVRIPAIQYHRIARVLDVGVMGVMAPMVETEEQARLIVAAAKYPPIGKRGAAFGIAHDDFEAGGDILVTMRSANDEGLIIAQIETVTGVENVERIAAVEGIDVLWIGHFDLTNSLGVPGQFSHPRYLAAVDRVLAAGRQRGKAIGIMTASAESGRALRAQGFRCLAYWGDLWIYGQALRQGIRGIRDGE